MNAVPPSRHPVEAIAVANESNPAPFRRWRFTSTSTSTFFETVNERFDSGGDGFIGGGGRVRIDLLPKIWRCRPHCRFRYFKSASPSFCTIWCWRCAPPSSRRATWSAGAARWRAKCSSSPTASSKSSGWFLARVFMVLLGVIGLYRVTVGYARFTFDSKDWRRIRGRQFRFLFGFIWLY